MHLGMYTWFRTVVVRWADNNNQKLVIYWFTHKHLYILQKLVEKKSIESYFKQAPCQTEHLWDVVEPYNCLVRKCMFCRCVK